MVFDDDANPGRMCTILDGRPRGPGDLSFRLLAAHSNASLFLAFRVRDQFLDDQRSDRRIGSPRFNFNDAAHVFINGDLVANDMPGYWSGVENGNREGFQVLADVLGQKLSVSTEFGNDDWKAGTRRTSDGYIVEFEIPLGPDRHQGRARVPTGDHRLVPAHERGRGRQRRARRAGDEPRDPLGRGPRELDLTGRANSPGSSACG